MHNVCYLRKMLKNDGGFSLIEVVLAVAILALVSLPILNYYTYSSLKTVDGREKQTATLMAEEIMEEMKSYSNFGQLEKILETPGPTATPLPVGEYAWELDESPMYLPEASAFPEPAAFNAKRKFDVQWNEDSRGEYLAKVHINYGEYNEDTRTVDGNSIDEAQYNDYAIPRPKEVYSNKNVVAAEDDELDLALSYFYSVRKSKTPATPIPADYDPPVNEPVATVVPPMASGAPAGDVDPLMTEIMANIGRKICIKVGYEVGSSKKTYIVTVSYVYTHNYTKGGNAETLQKEIVLEEKKIDEDKLKCIYVFYNMLNKDATEDRFSLDFTAGISEEEAEKINIFIGCQNINERTNSTYKITGVSISNKASSAKYYTNVYGPDGNPAYSGLFPSMGKFVSTEDVPYKRIGKIIVDIYNRNEVAKGKEIAHVESVLAE